MSFLPYLERLSLYGLGEPLLSEIFWTIIEHENTKDIPNVDINSNGTLLNEKNVDRLLHSNLNALRISIEGAQHLKHTRKFAAATLRK
jgi:MoaA/NifB/PqqE/SkfB family radical SAM enzyme